MRFLFSLLFALCGVACVGVVQDEVPIKTQVVTFPQGAVVEFNGLPVGRAPAAVILPQDTNGRLTERTILRAVPNTAQPMLFAQTRILDPAIHTERVPNQILIDLTLADTNSVAVPQTTHIQSGSTNSRPVRPRPVDRGGKPTQPVGIDRWNPGTY